MLYLLTQTVPQLPPLQVAEPWWLTVIKSGIVPVLALVGVWWTLKGHDRRLRTEQLERRAKDIHKELQQCYGEFGAAASEALEAAWKIAELYEDEDLYRYGFFTGPEEPTDEERDGRIAETLEEREAMRKRKKVALEKLSLAYCRLYLLEDDTDRLAHIEKFYSDVQAVQYSFRDPDKEEAHLQWSKRLNRFMRWAGDCLEVSYREAQSLAAKGQWPQRKIVVPAEHN